MVDSVGIRDKLVSNKWNIVKAALIISVLVILIGATLLTVIIYALSNDVSHRL